jgi:hypothetical protein
MLNDVYRCSYNGMKYKYNKLQKFKTKESIKQTIKQTKLHGLSTQASYTDRAAAACR